MAESEFLERLAKAIIDIDEEGAKKAAEEAIAAGVDPLKAIKEGLAKGMGEVGRRFREFKVFLPHVLVAADAMKAALSVLEPHIPRDRLGEMSAGKVVIGTCYGDIHDMGKNIVCALLSAAGFEVHDLGVGVHPRDFIKKVKEVNADIIAMSVLLTPSLPYQRDLVKDLEDEGLRGKYYIIIGGGATYPAWAEQVGVDGWGLHAEDGVEICRDFMKERRAPPFPKPEIKGR